MGHDVGAEYEISDAISGYKRNLVKLSQRIVPSAMMSEIRE
jgi:hypothetical protein